MAQNQIPQRVDRALTRASQILTRTFHKHHQEINTDLDLLVNPKKVDIDQTQPKRKEETQAHGHAHNHDHDKITGNNKLSNATPYILLIALCLDGFFEGLAIGAQSSWQNVFFVGISVVINKLAVAFGLGISFKKAETEIKTFIRLILLFSLFCPFGIVLGYLLSSNLLANSIFLSFSAGTFIYVSASVVIVEEFTLTKRRYTKFLCYLIGGLATAGIAIAGAL